MKPSKPPENLLMALFAASTTQLTPLSIQLITRSSTCFSSILKGSPCSHRTLGFVESLRHVGCSVSCERGGTWANAQVNNPTRLGLTPKSNKDTRDWVWGWVWVWVVDLGGAQVAQVGRGLGIGRGGTLPGFWGLVGVEPRSVWGLGGTEPCPSGLRRLERV